MQENKFEESPLHLYTYRLRTLLHRSQDSPLTAQVYFRGRMKHSWAQDKYQCHIQREVNPHVAESQDVVPFTEVGERFMDCLILVLKLPKKATITTILTVTTLTMKSICFYIILIFKHFVCVVQALEHAFLELHQNDGYSFSCCIPAL